MPTLQQKIDFAVVFRVTKANPNGDPLNGNRPRTDYDGYGEVTDVCIKRKMRDRLLERWVAKGRKEDGNLIFVQSDDRKEDDATSLRMRAEAALGNKLGSSETRKLACARWFDVRAFGQLFALPKAGKKKKDQQDEEGDTGISIGIRGPVSVQSAFSVEPVAPLLTSTQITKSVSGEGDGSKRSSDTMGMKHRVDRGIYVFFGSMNPQLAEKTGFNDADAQAIKQVLPKLFENDASSARPEGSMEVLKVIWWQHNSKGGQYSSAKVHRTLTVKHDGSYELGSLNGLTPEIIDGF
ncbi:MAG: type I-C CRISPR-associated protein Cas7/Csd2 [Nitrospira sp. WS238]|nr:type I-C CRISPR-associated protein Cas7/Csd2 [Nitrospira sp. WS238]